MAEPMADKSWCRDRAAGISQRLAAWRGAVAMPVCFGHRRTDFSSLSTPENSDLEVELTHRDGRKARLHCVAVYDVRFMCFWRTIDLKVEHDEKAMADFVVSDGARFRVQCADVHLEEPAKAGQEDEG